MTGEEQGQDEVRTWRDSSNGGGLVMGEASQSEAITQQMQGLQTFTREELEECLAFLQRMSSHISAELAEKPHLDRDTHARLTGELQRNDAWSAEITTRLKGLPRSSGGATTRRLERLPSEPEVICAACGARNRGGAHFCTACGHTLPTAAQTLQLSIKMTVGQLSDMGVVRKNNEDAIFVHELALPASLGGGKGWLGLVADGMGGANAGEVASGIAVTDAPRYVMEHLAEVTGPQGVEALLKKALELANKSIYDQARKRMGQRGMGTTSTFALLDPAMERAWIAHIGDSRAYLLNRLGVSMKGAGNRTIVQLTTDHSVVARLMELGQLTAAEAAQSPHRSVLYRSLGTEANSEIDTSAYPLQSGDRLLLCSDGLMAHLKDSDIASITLRYDAPQAARALVEETKRRGATDNVSVIIFALDLSSL
jgi:serine/threonine protein phosphatase PrpC